MFLRAPHRTIGFRTEEFASYFHNKKVSTCTTKIGYSRSQCFPLGLDYFGDTKKSTLACPPSASSLWRRGAKIKERGEEETQTRYLRAPTFLLLLIQLEIANREPTHHLSSRQPSLSAATRERAPYGYYAANRKSSTSSVCITPPYLLTPINGRLFDCKIDQLPRMLPTLGGTFTFCGERKRKN